MHQTSAKKGLDEIDKRILSILQEDSRKSFVEIANELNFSETAVRNRVKKLVESGVIKKFSLQLDAEKVGRFVTAVIGIKIGGEVGPVAASGLVEIDEITDIYTVTGEYDLISKVICKSVTDLEQVVEKIRALEFTNETNTFLVLHKVKEGSSIRLDI